MLSQVHGIIVFIYSKVQSSLAQIIQALPGLFDEINLTAIGPALRP